MHNMKLPLALAVLLLGAGCSNLERSRNLSDPQVSGKTLAQQVCAFCHGVDGNAVSPQFPRLAGQQKDYLVTQLKNFRGHGRSDPAGSEYMWGLSRSLTDAQIDGIAEYFNHQAPAPNPAPVDAARVAAGKQIFENGVPDKGAPPCSACHGPEAQGLANFPRLAGQHEDYIIKQLHVFRETDQRPDTPMGAVAHGLEPQQIANVAGYLQSLSSAGAAK